MNKTKLPQEEDILIISKDIFRFRLVPRKVIEKKDSIFLSELSDITRQTKGKIEAYVTEMLQPDKIDIALFGKTEPVPFSYWKKIGNYVEDITEEPDYDRIITNLDLYFGNKRICLKTINSVAPTKQSGVVEEREHVYKNWKEKRTLENLIVVRTPVRN